MKTGQLANWPPNWEQSEERIVADDATGGNTSETQMPRMPQQDIKVIPMMRAAGGKKSYGERCVKRERGPKG